MSSFDHEPETCPVCGDMNMEWGDREILDTSITYSWTCKTCGTDGIEVWDTVFSAHNIIRQGCLKKAKEGA